MEIVKGQILDAKWNIHSIVVVMSTVSQLTRTDNLGGAGKSAV